MIMSKPSIEMGAPHENNTLDAQELLRVRKLVLIWMEYVLRMAIVYQDVIAEVDSFEMYLQTSAFQLNNAQVKHFFIYSNC